MGTLLNLLNGERIPDHWTGDDREVLAAYLSALRRRTAGVRPAGRFSVRSLTDGTAVLLEDDAPKAVAAVRAPNVNRVALKATNRGTLVVECEVLEGHATTPFPSGIVMFHRSRNGDKQGRDRWQRYPSDYARSLADFLREHGQLAPWPEDAALLSGSNLSAAALEQIAAWRAEWSNIQSACLARCRQPSCETPGGRLFIPHKSQRDCDGCRKTSKATRWRHGRQAI